MVLFPENNRIMICIQFEIYEFTIISRVVSVPMTVETMLMLPGAIPVGVLGVSGLNDFLQTQRHWKR